MSKADRISGFCKKVKERGDQSQDLSKQLHQRAHPILSTLPGYEVSLTTSGWAGSTRASEAESSFIESSSATQGKGKERVRDH